MESNSLDRLAQAGIINFDADAFVKGTAPRYAGKPEEDSISPMDEPIRPYFYGINPGEHIKGEPSTDAFVQHKNKENHNGGYHRFPLKETIVGGLAATLAIATGIKIKNIFGKKGKKNSGKAESGIKKFFSNAKEKITSFFKSTDKTKKATPEAKVETKAETIEKTAEDGKKAVSNALKNIKEWVTKLPKPAKVAGAIGVGLLGLYGLFSFFPQRNPNEFERR